MSTRQGFSNTELTQFERDGFVVVRQLANSDLVTRMSAVATDHLTRCVAPVEYETDTHYPGAPKSPAAVGGKTIRRLLTAHARDAVFTEWLIHPALTQRIKSLLGNEIMVPLAHHNCIMTKQPEFSSDTDWHQDVRYWHFQRDDLVNAWLALGHENRQNGALRLIPGSHRLTFEPRQFDDSIFFRNDTAPNRALIKRQVMMTMQPGDVVFFHARCLHSASRNHSKHTKYSVVFSFRPADNQPLSDTRSSRFPELKIP